MISLPFRASHIFVRVATCVGLAACAACSSPPTRFYTLAAGDSRGSISGVSNATLLIDMLAVHVPAPVAGSRLVVQTSPTRVDILEDDRWASPVGDEIRGALSILVTRQSNAVDVHGVPHDDNLPVYRVAIEIQRFESWPGSHVLIDAVWSVRQAHGQQTLTCHGVIRENVSEGNDALVDGHRRALEEIASEIAVGIRGVAATPVSAWTASDMTPASTVRCPASTGAGRKAHARLIDPVG
ncbi:membrane integrity-associated transporter subunit PqiC [Burkholderia stabilis]|uniref:PqiC family protein n=1 Tax=Burkholderia stabilis TaxID=95485 RepID=UPI00080B8003|nr:PqiC family protein [Burkholderia stabilis]GAU06765.1 lipoprotein [Burkholderia stabilis]